VTWRSTMFALLAGVVACRGSDHPSAGPISDDPLFLLGDSLYQAQEYDSARATWALALVQARQARDSTRQARILTELGIAHYRLGNLTEARQSQEEAIALKTSLALGDASQSRSLNALGLVAKEEGRYVEAVRLFERAIEAGKAAGDQTALDRASGNIGLPLASLGEFGRARTAYRSLRAAGRRANNVQFEGNGLLNEAMLDNWEGDPLSAVARIDSARALYRSDGNRTGEQFALGQRAASLELMGDLDGAFAALDSALIVARELGMQSEEADDLRLIAGLHAAAGDWRRAIRFYGQADSLFAVLGFESSRGAVQRGEASAYLALRNPARARTRAEAALALHQQSGEALEELDDRFLLAEIDQPAGSSRGHLEAARRIAATLATHSARMSVALAMAGEADRRGDAEAVARTVAPMIADLSTGDLWAEWQVYAYAARAEARRGRLDSAAVLGRRAVQAVERQRTGLSSETLRGTFVTDRADVYGDLVVTLLRLGRSDEAFAVADAARSRGLLEHLTAAKAGSPAPDLVRGEELLRRIDALMRRIRETEPTRPLERGASRDTVAVVLERQLAEARSEYEGLIARSPLDATRAVAMLGAGVMRLDDVRRAIEDDEVLLEYLVTSDRLIIFVLWRDGFRVLEEPLDAATLRHRIELVRDLWRTAGSDWRLGLPASRALHGTLIGPLRKLQLLAGNHRLLIVPHGVLGQLPFAALQDSTTGRFLAEDYSVSHLPSAMALASLRRDTTVSSRIAGSGEGLAPFPRELPATVSEVGAFRLARPGATSRIGPDASEAAIRLALTRGAPVHVATHGTLNVRNPMFSRIELSAPSRPAGPANDGRLEVHELLGITIRSPLVFLSGCETGAGQAWSDDPVRGTADLTLAQAALSAGAGNVVSTLWRIQDEGAARFAGRFYMHLREASVSAALALAQREMIADPAYASPYYWAGYVLSGEGRFGEQTQTALVKSVPQVRADVAARTQPRKVQ